jgi:hypothetical protein
MVSFSLIFLRGHYQVDVLQLQMVIASYYYTIIDMSLHNSYISYGKSDPRVACLHELFLMKRPSSEEWHIAVGH